MVHLGARLANEIKSQLLGDLRTQSPPAPSDAVDADSALGGFDLHTNGTPRFLLR